MLSMAALRGEHLQPGSWNKPALNFESCVVTFGAFEHLSALEKSSPEQFRARRAFPAGVAPRAAARPDLTGSDIDAGMEIMKIKSTARRAGHKDSVEANAARLMRAATLHRWGSERFRGAIEGQILIL